jgi:diguanylate cyclase (GGDEF)-like protein/PAS domain S-box-containing protein
MTQRVSVDSARITDRRWIVRIAFLYTALVGLWVLVQSGALLAYLLGLEVERVTWLQTFSGWFFVLATAWLLYLLIERNQRAAREAAAALLLRDRAIESSVNAIIITDHLTGDGSIIYVNPAFERITGYRAAEAIGRNPRFLHNEDRDQPGLQDLRTAVARNLPEHALIRNYRRDGSMFWNDLHIAPVRDESGRVTHYVGVQNDITETKRYQEALEFQANHDVLTGLPNRNLLQDRIRQAIVHADRHRTLVAVALVNLDNFGLVNDTLGRDAGDRVLKEIALRVSAGVRSLDTVARLAGDDFALVSFDHENEDAVSAELQRVHDTLSRPFDVDGREIFVTSSAGVVLYPQDGKSVEELLRNANAAMHRAKARGKNNTQFYAPDMNARIGERLDLYGKLRHALERGEFLLHYQPQVELKTGGVVGVEALIRWKHPELGMVSPARFIPLAEETGLIVAIGEWVLRTACAQNRKWQDAGLPPITVAVNLSGRQFNQKDLVQMVARTLREARLEARYLELEITEGVVMDNPAGVIVTLTALRDMGVQLSIDDFGTGYSSLNYLKRFPVNRLKIDQSFVRDITTDADDAAIARAVISLGHTLNLKVIAEGVETREQLTFLRLSGCDEKQGYYFSKPLPAEEVTEVLKAGRTLAF